MIVLIRIQDAFTSLTIRSQGNFDSICVCLHEYELCRTGLCSFELVAGGLGCGGQSWVSGDGFRWLRMVSGRMVSDRVGLLRMVSDGLGWFAVLVITVYMYIYMYIYICIYIYIYICMYIYILFSVVPFLYFDQFLYHLLPFS